VPEIYLHLDGQQAGPYQPAQVRQLLAEGKISDETFAWHKDLTEWSTVAQALAQFPAGPPPYVPPPAVPRAPAAAPAKSELDGCAVSAIIAGVCIFLGLLVLGILAGVAVGPIHAAMEKAQETASMQQTRAIALAMFEYANDHGGKYPDGNTSTQVFQKLLDGKYVSDPALFYISMPGKIRATSNTLTSDNVCFDVTAGVTADSADTVPLVFVTGYTINYRTWAAALKEPGATPPFPGVAVAYKSNSARFLKADPDGTVPNFIVPNLDPAMSTYRQLKP
jgi:type II secretory pathway pseudopilin PulG